MIIADFIKTERIPSRSIPNELRGRVKTAIHLVEEYEKAFKRHRYSTIPGGGGLRIAWRNFAPEEISERKNQLDRARQQMERERYDIFEIMGGTIPKSLGCNRNDPLSVASVMPRSSLGEIRKIADMLGFIVMPFDCMAEEGWNEESEDVRKCIHNFYNGMKSIRNVYVLSPIGLYDFDKHVQGSHLLPIYAAPPLQQTITSVEIVLPFCRATYRRLVRLDEDLTELHEEMGDIKLQLHSLEQRMQSLENFRQQQQRENARQKRQEAIEAQRIAMTMNEPLMFAVNREHDIVSGDGQIILGPCWGPDFDDIVEAMIAVKKKKNQRNRLSHAAQQWNWN